MTMTTWATMTTTLTMTMTMTMTMTIDSDVLAVLPEVALMGLDHHARTTRGQTRVLMAPHQPDPTTGSAKTQTDPTAPMELILSALTAALLPRSQSVQAPLTLSFSGLKGGTTYQGTTRDLVYIELSANWHLQENLTMTELKDLIHFHMENVIKEHKKFQ